MPVRADLQHSAVHSRCNTLQHAQCKANEFVGVCLFAPTATHCNACLCYTLQRAARTSMHTERVRGCAPICAALQHTATHSLCNTLQQLRRNANEFAGVCLFVPHCNTLQHTLSATRCTLNATRTSSWGRAYLRRLQHTLFATRCNTLQHARCNANQFVGVPLRAALQPPLQHNLSEQNLSATHCNTPQHTRCNANEFAVVCPRAPLLHVGLAVCSVFSRVFAAFFFLLSQVSRDCYRSLLKIGSLLTVTGLF